MSHSDAELVVAIEQAYRSGYQRFLRLWRALLNVCLTEKPPTRRLEPGDEPAANGQPAEWPEVRAAIAALPQRQRIVLFLRHYADLDYQQIADVVGIAFRSRLQRPPSSRSPPRGRAGRRCWRRRAQRSVRREPTP